MHLDERPHLLDDVVGIPQRAEALFGHPRSDHLVVMKLHAVGRDPARLGLPDVVQQRGQAQHEVRLASLHDREGVPQHVLVLVHGILLEP